MSANDTAHHFQAFWQTRIKACDEQSISKAKYCRDNELTYHCFIYWYAKYSERVNVHMPAQREQCFWPNVNTDTGST